MSPVSPRAKALAEKEAVNAAALTGTGPHGRVIERDVKAAAEAAPKTTPLAKAIIKETGAALPTAGSGLAGMAKGADVGALKNSVYATDSEIKPISNMRKIIAKAMHASLQNSAQLTHHLSADARRIMALRKKVKKAVENGYPTNITLNDIILFAVSRVLAKPEHKALNAHLLNGDTMRYFNGVHLGVAVDTDRGLVVPTIKNAQNMSLNEISAKAKELATTCKNGGATPDMLSGASFTVSNVGSYGIESFTPVINTPQTGILGVDTITTRIREVNGEIKTYPAMGLSLTYDHRALDGSPASRFLVDLRNALENFSLLLSK